MKLTVNNTLDWGKNYSNWLPLIQWCGWIFITLLVAKMFWALTLHFSGDDVSLQKVSVSRQSQSAAPQQVVSVSGLVQRHLFGNAEAPAEVPTEIIEVVETRLNLKLRGTYAANNKATSNSIIEDSKGKQEVYFVDDKLKVSGNVFLRQVYADKVILETNGTMEELRLKDDVPDLKRSSSKTVTSQKSKQNRVDDKRKNAQITKSLSDYRDKLKEDPLSLIGLVKYQPKIVDGEMTGVQISPGKDKRLFTQLGLRRRDVITAINGVSLTNPQDALQLMAEIQDMQELQVEISRGNESISLLLNLAATDSSDSDEESEKDEASPAEREPVGLDLQ